MFEAFTNRAFTEPDYRFVPIPAGSNPNPRSLPGFAQSLLESGS